MKKYMKIIIPIAVFAIVAIILTVILIIVNKPESEKTSKKPARNGVVEREKYGIGSLTDKVDVPPLEYQLCEGGDYIDASQSTWYEIKAIRGLKDRTVESKINDQLKSCRYFVSSNFGNTLSLVRYGNDEYTEFTGLNIRLDTGERFQFEDIFLAEANIESLIAKAVEFEYSCYASGGCYPYMGGEATDYIKAPKGFDLDEEILANIYLYREQGITNFHLTDKYVEFDLGDETFMLIFESVWEDLALYKRFGDMSIYEKQPTVKRYVLSYYYGGKMNDFVLDNLFVNWDYHYYDTEIPSKVVTAFEKELDKVLEEVKKLAASDKNNFYVLAISPYYITGTDGGVYYINTSDIYINKMSIKLYEKYGKEKFIAASQRLPRMFGGFVWAVEGEDWEKVIEVKMSKYITGTSLLDKNANALKKADYCITEDYGPLKKGSTFTDWMDDEFHIDSNCKITKVVHEVECPTCDEDE